MNASLAQELARGATLVTPNRRLARELKRRFDAAQIAQGAIVWPTADVLPWRAWLERTYAQLTRASQHARLLAPLQDLALWQKTIAESQHAHALLDAGALARIARDAWQLAHAWRLDLEAAASQFHEDAKAFAGWAARFRTACDVRGWLDGARLPDALIRLHIEAAASVPHALLLYGFDELTAQDQALLAALRGAGVRIETLQPEPHDATIARRSYATPEDELADVARRARELIETNPNTRIGVVVPDLARRRSEALRQFDDALEPDRVLPATPARVRLYNVSAGTALTRYAAVHAALLVLRLARGELPLNDVGVLLRGPFLAAAESELARRALLDARLRRRGALAVKLADLRTEARGSGAYGCPALVALLEPWSRLAADAWGSEQLPSAWSAVFTSLLSGLGWPGERSLDSEDFQIVEKWREVVADLARLDHVLGAVRYDEALSWLSRSCAETLFQPESRDAPIQVLGILESAGLEFDHLFVTGLHDEAWPVAARPNPLLPVNLQRARGVPHASPEWELEFARRMTALWRGAAGSVWFSYATGDGDRALGMSPLLADFAAADADGSTTWSDYPERIRAAADIERLVDQQAPALPSGTHAPGGATVFRNQSDCPFRAFATHRLGARALEEGHFGLDARHRGIVLHAAAAHLWNRLQTQATLLALDAAALHDIVLSAADAGVACVERKRPEALPRAMMAIERDRVADLLTQLLALERQRAPFAVLHVEHSRAIELGGLRIDARMDRIDATDAGERVILDYKGGQAAFKGWMQQRPDEPQLPLYAVTDDGDVAALSFALLNAEKVAFDGLSRSADLLPGVDELAKTKYAREFDSWTALLSRWRTVLEALAHEFLSGHASVQPKRYPQTCEHCDLGTLCRIKELRRREVENE